MAPAFRTQRASSTPASKATRDGRSTSTRGRRSTRAHSKHWSRPRWPRMVRRRSGRTPAATVPEYCRMRATSQGAAALALTIALGAVLRSQEDGAVAVLRRMLTTVNAGDARGYAALYAPSAIITIYGSGQLTGRRAIEQHEVALLKQFPGTGFAMYDIWRAGETTIAH